MNELAIDLRNVTKVYRGRVHALQGIEMRVGRGEVFGLLGPNGAGKSTLVKIMMTVIRPTRAEGTVLGRKVGDKPTLARVGYLPENHRFPRYLTGRQTIEFFAALAGMPRTLRRRRASELLDVVGMSEWADRKVATYSKGMMQRVGLAQALSNDPDLVLLDEPTDGVDPVGRKEIRDVLANVKRQGKTVFINSHMLSELEMICDRVAILVGGKVARQGTIDELAVAKQRYEIDIAPANGDAQLTDHRELIARVLGATFTHTTTPPPMRYAGQAPPVPPMPIEHGSLAQGWWLELQGRTLRVGTTDAGDAQSLLDALRRAGITVLRFQNVRPSLEDLFIDALADLGAAARRRAAECACALDWNPFMTTPQATIIPEYQSPSAPGGLPAAIIQTVAMFVDAYRELNARKMFWIVLILSGIVVIAFAGVGINDKGLTLFGMSLPLGFNTSIMPRGEFYKMMFNTLGVGIWLSWAASILALISTAGIFPDMLTGGSVDLYLSKPITRLRFFLTKYAAALLFVTVQVGIFTFTSFLVLGFRGGVWLWGLFLTIPVMVCFFSYLYAVCTLLGILTRSTLAALLLTLLVWFSVWIIHSTESTLLFFQLRSDAQLSQYNRQIASAQKTIDRLQASHGSTQPSTAPVEAAQDDNASFLMRIARAMATQAEKQRPDEALQSARNELAQATKQRDEWSNPFIFWHRATITLKFVLPKTTETIELLNRGLAKYANMHTVADEDPDEAEAANASRNGGRQRGEGGIDRVARTELAQQIHSRSLGWVVGTSLMFEAVMLTLAAWVFCRRDY